ncbi:MAG: type II secretion system F family protein [Johnsonella sp.]|nr:type II secretion system F family protein [Johnsonella sp.]
MEWILSLSMAVFTFCIIYLLFCKLVEGRLNLHRRLDYVAEIAESERRNKKKRGGKKEELFRFVRVSRSFRENILLSGINMKPEEFILTWFVGVFLIAIITFTFTTNIIRTLALTVLAVLIPPLYIKHKIKQKRALFQVQLGDSLMILANALRSGFSFSQALSSASLSMPEPLGTEFATVVKEMQIGVGVEESLLKVAEKMKSEDLKLLATAVVVQQQVGGNLSEILDTLALTIRNRMAVLRTVKTLTAQGKASGLLVGGLPIFLLIAISFISPDYIQPLFGTLIGKMILAGAALMQTIGFLIIRKMIDIKL